MWVDPRRWRLGLRLVSWGLFGVPLCLLLLGVYQGVREHPESFAGLPRSQQLVVPPWSGQWFHVIDPPGFVLGYSEFHRHPLWVAYRLDGPRDGPLPARPRHFEVDYRTLLRVGADDFRNTGYDRGHLAPNYAMARFHGRSAQLASFRMSNITPQRRGLNQKLWQRLEEIETDVYAAADGPLWVVMGPVFDQDGPRLDTGISVPQAFFRIWVRQGPDGPQVLAFVVPQDVRGDEPLDQFLSTVDAIEALTGLDLFHRLEDERERALESGIDAVAWGFARHARRPPRY